MKIATEKNPSHSKILYIVPMYLTTYKRNCFIPYKSNIKSIDMYL